MNIPFPKQYLPLFNEQLRHIGFHGGRGGAKSWSFAKAAIERGRRKKIRILCVREIQKSIKESVHQLLKETIDRYGFTDYVVTDNSIKNRITGTEFFFMGLYRNIDSIKSVEGVDICWVEEAQSVSTESLVKLIPTIRKDGSQIWYSFNRSAENDPVWEIVFKNPDNKTYIAKVNITDLHKEFQSEILLDEMERDRQRDYNLYLHIWCGEPLGQAANAAIDRAEIIKAMERNIPVDRNGKIMTGADIAREGDDLITFYKVCGFKTIDEQIHSFLKTTETERRLKFFIGDKSVLSKIDMGNMGSGIYDHLVEDGYNMHGINFGGRTAVKQRDKYYDIATEMMMDFAENIGELDIPQDDDLLDELAMRRVFYKDVSVELGGKRVDRTVKMIEPKRIFKERVKRSPDKSDGIVMAYYIPKIEPVPRIRYI